MIDFKKLLFKSLLILPLFTCNVLNAQVADGGKYPFQNPALPVVQRVDDLMKRLTADEKIGLMMDSSRPVQRLGIKQYNWWNEALHGVGRAGLATVYPQAIGMAASFNDEAVERAFTSVSDEARAKYNEFSKTNDLRRYHCLTFWTPNINIFRDPRWGRGQETYGEDPYLTTRMGVAVVNGLQGPKDSDYDKLHACAKHYAVHSGPEWNRHSFDAKNIAPRDLWETYLPAFEALVKEADVKQVMCAYNRYEGKPCCGSDQLLTSILRNQWGYKHLVVSDCGAIDDFYQKGKHETHPTASEASAAAVIAGTDVECGSSYRSLKEGLEKGYITEDQLNISVRRLLTSRFELGEMDDPSLVSWSKIAIDTVDCPLHKQLALDMARQSMTLLMNKNNILPLKKKGLKIVVMGPNANDSVMQWGNYNGTPGHTVTILDGIRQKIGDVEYIKGCDLVTNHTFISSYGKLKCEGNKKGMLAKYWNNTDFSGTPVATQVLSEPFVQNAGGNTTFAPDVNITDFSASYAAEYYAEKDEEIAFEIGGRNTTLYINGAKCIAPRGNQTVVYKHKAEQGKTYQIEIKFASQTGRVAFVDFNLGNYIEIPASVAAEKAKDADIVIFAGGISPRLEGEEMMVTYEGFKGGDRTDIELPKVQRELMQTLKKAGKKVIFVSCSGSSLALVPETESCDAILQAWYPGQAGGTAVADVLFGDYNPAGRLPVTFYKSVNQLPDFQDYSMVNRTYRYFKGEPLFCFGHGLSYTTFEYGKASLNQKPKAKKMKKPLQLTVNVKNTGNMDGDESIQVYLKNLQDPEGPVKMLRAFKRVPLKAGESKAVTIALKDNTFECFDPATKQMMVKPGKYELLIGGTSDDSKLKSISVELK